MWLGTNHGSRLVVQSLPQNAGVTYFGCDVECDHNFTSMLRPLADEDGCLVEQRVRGRKSKVTAGFAKDRDCMSSRSELLVSLTIVQPGNTNSMNPSHVSWRPLLCR